MSLGNWIHKKKSHFLSLIHQNLYLYYRINMSLPGLPPLPKSLSGLELTHHQPNQQQQNISKKISTPSVQPSKDTTLDTKLAILRREMVSFISFCTCYRYIFYASTIKEIVMRKRSNLKTWFIRYSIHSSFLIIFWKKFMIFSWSSFNMWGSKID